MGETRINLKHLLEDIRDSYVTPAEETIITELVANALDSGAARVDFWTNREEGHLTVVDDGSGMSRKTFVPYHDIAATTKARGKGIGFAGVGAKLSLLLAKSVYTETRNGRFHRATRWCLESERRAPWRFVKALSLVTTRSGTAVRFFLNDPRSVLLDAAYLETVLLRHFEPLLLSRFHEALYQRLYRREIVFFINGRKSLLPDAPKPRESRAFEVRVGKRAGFAGFGILFFYEEDQPEEKTGIAVSTYGKIIKRGWEWLGLRPRHPARLYGIVELPGLSSLLTTNKADFLKDGTSLRTYYRFRKALLAALRPILAAFGEDSASSGETERRLKSQREIEEALSGLLEDFPELTAVLDRRRKSLPASASEGSAQEGLLSSERTCSPHAAAAEEKEELPQEYKKPPVPSKRKGSGLQVLLRAHPEKEEAAWVEENGVVVNTAHPAYEKAAREGAVDYHAAVAVALALSSFLEEDRSVVGFFNCFLRSWGNDRGAGENQG